MTQSASDACISDLEAAKLLLDEWKFRQQHCWSILPRYGLAAVIVSIVPYLRIELFTTYHIKMLIFPWIGLLLALAATWLFVAEQYRCYSVLQHYRMLIGKDRINRTDTRLDRLLDWIKVRWATPMIFLIIFVVLTIWNIKILTTIP